LNTVLKIKMKQNKETHRIIISGGGTGGHIYPAIAIADAIKKLEPDAEILFVGATGRMEMEKVPSAGYSIKGLPIAGLQRGYSPSALISNLALPIRLLKSIREAGRILRDFKPHVAVGVGGYASGPLLWAASRRRIPYYLQEQNGFAGKTNKMLAGKAEKIFVAYPDMDKFFPAEKIVLTGNPIRSQIRLADAQQKASALAFFGLDPHKKTLLVIGGSLGAATLNRCMIDFLPLAAESGIQVIWQCGRSGKEAATAAMNTYTGIPVFLYDFLSRMDLAYAVADVVISRAGAGSISELCIAGKACIFVPSPNVAEDHQTHNAMALVKEHAGLLIRDADAQTELMPTALKLIKDPEKTNLFSSNILKISRPDAASQIAEIILEK
jgi:UDP-N-acetylglucosamine--N-acetylmuramyl-(pentapeptide) pyrophosphoryl-undecaprenol N-acetylglucosamine transferase